MNKISTQQYCILKADDFIGEEGSAFFKFFDLIKEKNIKASVGVISSGYPISNPSNHLVTYVQNLHNSGQFEFWNHGNTHKSYSKNIKEFKGRAYDLQYKDMMHGQDIMKKTYGITMRSFGAPFNAIDSVTSKVIKNIPEINVWIFTQDGITVPKGVVSFPEANQTLIEHNPKNDGKWNPRPNYEAFKKNYDPSKKYIVSQLHPKRWTNNKDWAEFEKIIAFLIARKVRFILPTDLLSTQVKLI
ncbi:MAG: DUF2334 domain-containing protein [Methylococcales bacterium]|nr:DUF2334 domain-containing protein [Methylococcales bacterium]